MQDEAHITPILKRITESLSKSTTVSLNPKEVGALFAEAVQANDTLPWTITIRQGKSGDFFVEGVIVPSLDLWIHERTLEGRIVISVEMGGMLKKHWDVK